MEQHLASNQLAERRSEPRTKVEQYYSAELAVEGLDVPYQFKIMNLASSSMAVLVKENSEIVPRLKVGDTLKVKYYSQESPYPSDYLPTAVRHITRNDQGRLKGHYLVGLEIIGDRT